MSITRRVVALTTVELLNANGASLNPMPPGTVFTELLRFSDTASDWIGTYGHDLDLFIRYRPCQVAPLADPIASTIADGREKLRNLEPGTTRDRIEQVVETLAAELAEDRRKAMT